MAQQDKRRQRQEQLPRQVYPFRTMGFALGALPIGVSLFEQQAPWPLWALLLITTLAWPPLARYMALRAADPHRREIAHLQWDSVMAGFWAGLIHFNPLPTALLLVAAVVDRVRIGIEGVWQRSLAWIGLGMALGAALGGWRWHSETSKAMVAACVPFILIYFIVVNVSHQRLLLRLQEKNQQLKALSLQDGMTGFASRHAWVRQASAILERFKQGGCGEVVMVMVDFDQFKQINDRYGHAVGDDLLIQIARTLRQGFADALCVGRLGGDEFALVLNGPLPEAAHIANAVCQQVAAQSFANMPGLRCSISCGLACAHPQMLSLREWAIQADAAMYQAKRAGGGQIAIWQEGMAGSLR